MKSLKRFSAIFLALAMVVGMILPSIGRVNAENTESTDPKAVTKTVTVHKMLLSKDTLKNPKFPGVDGITSGKYNGNKITDTDKFFGTGAKEMADVVFAWQKKVGNEWKYIDKDGNPLQTQPTKETEEAFKDVLKGKTTVNGFEFKDLGQFNGEYQIVEVKGLSNYKGEKGEVIVASKAVPVKLTMPVRNERGTVENAHVYPKNAVDKPQIDKNFASSDLNKVGENGEVEPNVGANYENYAKKKARVTAELGKEIPYEIKTKVNAGTAYEKLVWKDTMTNGLTFKHTDSSNGVTITATNLNSDLVPGDYVISSDDRGFTLHLTDNGLKKVKEATKPGETSGSDVEFTLKYSAIVNGNAIVDNTEKNSVNLEYGHKPYENKEPTPVKPSQGKLKVNKTWGEKNTTPKDGTTVTYTLTNGTITVAVTLNGSETKDHEYDLGNKITFKVTGEYSGEFSGETLTGNNWKISERVAGYNETIIGGENGTVSISNKKDEENPTPLKPTEPEVVNGGKKFVKTSDANTELLAGAKFVVYDTKTKKYLAYKGDTQKEGDTKNLDEAKKALDKKVDAYNKLSVENQKGVNGKSIKEEIDNLQEAYNKAFKKAAIGYTWVVSNSDSNVVLLTSNSKGQFEIQGLAYGKYELEETVSPTGYAKRNNIPFEVKNGSYESGDIKYDTSANKENALRVENKKVTIPQTGGIGTLIFAIAGLALMGFAAYAMKRNSKED